MTTRTLQRWQKAGADLADPVALAAFVRGLSRPSESVALRVSRGNFEEDLRGVLDSESPPLFSASCLADFKSAFTALLVARKLLGEDPEFVAYFGGGDVAKAHSVFGVTGKRELVTLLFAVMQILESQLDSMNHCFSEAIRRD